MKKTCMSVATIILVISPFNAPAQLATIDVAAIAEAVSQFQAATSQITNQLSQISQLSSQITNQLSQITQMSCNLLNMGSVSAFFNIGSLLNGSLVGDINDLNSIGDFSDLNLGGIISNVSGGLTSSLAINSSTFMHLENLLCSAASSFDGGTVSPTAGFSSVTCRMAGLQATQDNEDKVQSNTISVMSTLAADESSLLTQITHASDVATQTGLMAQLSEDHALAERAQMAEMLAHNATVNAYMANDAMSKAAELQQQNLDCSIALGIVSTQMASEFSAAENVFDQSYAASVSPVFTFSYIPPQ
jgi:hypothetical protein